MEISVVPVMVIKIDGQGPFLTCDPQNANIVLATAEKYATGDRLLKIQDLRKQFQHQKNRLYPTRMTPDVEEVLLRLIVQDVHQLVKDGVIDPGLVEKALQNHFANVNPKT